MPTCCAAGCRPPSRRTGRHWPRRARSRDRQHRFGRIVRAGQLRARAHAGRYPHRAQPQRHHRSGDVAHVRRCRVRRLDTRGAAVIRVDSLWLAVEPIDMRAGADRRLARVVQVFGAAQGTSRLPVRQRPRHAHQAARARWLRCLVRSPAPEHRRLHLAAPSQRRGCSHPAHARAIRRVGAGSSVAATRAILRTAARRACGVGALPRSGRRGASTASGRPSGASRRGDGCGHAGRKRRPALQPGSAANSRSMPGSGSRSPWGAPTITTIEFWPRRWPSS